MKWARTTRQLGLAPLLFLLRPTAAQTFSSPPPPLNPEPVRPESGRVASPIVIVLCSFILFAILCRIYCSSQPRQSQRRRETWRLPVRVSAAAPSLDPAVSRGLDPAVVESFPKVGYSEVKQHKVGNGALECAVCLSEFEDNDALRLLPKCDHVFHPDCIDTWFAAHTTCPVCRTNLAQETAVAAPPESGITVVQGEGTLPPLPPGRQRRRISRSHSTGHAQAEDRERYTLRLPETVRRDVATRTFTRSTSC